MLSPTSTTSQFEREIDTLPQSWQFTPVRDKKPYIDDWTNKDLDREFIIQEVINGNATGYGIRLGKPSGYVMAIDCDGQSAIDWSSEKFSELPTTVTWTSGRPARYQTLYQVPDAYHDRLKDKIIQIGKEDYIEFRYTGNQSVLPPSAHPSTDGYKWINSPFDTPVAELPQVIIDYLLELIESKPLEKIERKHCGSSVLLEGVPPIPLVNCLAKSNRKLLTGTGMGGRNNAGAKLARDLIGCANYLDTEGIAFEGDPRRIFDEFVEGCTPPLDSDDKNEPNTIWRSAEGDNPEPSCMAEGVQNIIKAWNKEHTPKEPRKTATDLAVGIGQTVRYFQTINKVAYADIMINGNRHTYAVRSKSFRLWLSGEYFEQTGKGINSQALQEALNTIEAIAIFRGEVHEVHLRTAEYDGKIYLDLGTLDWKAAEIDIHGWRIISEPPVRFWRPESLLPLPYPVEGGKLDELKEFINVNRSSWILLITFLLFCFCPNKTYPVLVISAHRGSGKTAAAQIIKSLIDPGKAPLIELMSDTLKLAVAAARRLLIIFDNVGHISADQSDDLCRMATGFGLSTRTLHTTDEETTIEVTRPQIITLIDILVTRDDLADRALMIGLEEITEDKRIPQSELNAKVEAARPRILGALLTALSQTLAQLPYTNPDKLPRMADYAKFAIASEKALGLKQGEFTQTFNASRELARQGVLDATPLGAAIQHFMEGRLIWKGTASDLLKELEHHTESSTYRSRFFPQAPNRLKAQLNRLTPDLRAVGIEVKDDREGKAGTKTIYIEKIVKVSSASPADAERTKEDPSGKDFTADDKADDKLTIPTGIDDNIDDKSGGKPFSSNGYTADDTPTRKADGSLLADDTAEGADDSKTKHRQPIVSHETHLYQQLDAVAGHADDTDGKKLTLSELDQLPEATEELLQGEW